LEGQETDDEAILEKRYEEYVQDNGDIISQYAGRGLVLEIGTGMGIEESREKPCKKLDKNDKWSKVIGSLAMQTCERVSVVWILHCPTCQTKQKDMLSPCLEVHVIVEASRSAHQGA
jgi:hypothetical protein